MNRRLFDVGIIDPPWEFKSRGATESTPDKQYRGGSLSDQEIAALPVGKLFALDAVIFLWAVDWKSPKVADAVAESWGFRYATRAWVWVKSNPTGFGFWRGRGFYTMSNPEDCLIYVRGSMPVADRSIMAVMYDPVREHSRKPDDQYKRIERMYPNRAYCELFARRTRPGWAAWGDEIEDPDPDICAVLGVPNPSPSAPTSQ